LAKKTILTQKFSGQDRVQEKDILTQEADEKTNIAPTHNNWSSVRKEYGHVAYKEKQETKNKHKKENQKTAKKKTVLHDHITYAYEPMVRNRYDNQPDTSRTQQQTD
jgi:hypothetical protein